MPFEKEQSPDHKLNFIFTSEKITKITIKFNKII